MRAIATTALEPLLQVAASAPSAHNSQPWQCQARDGGLLVSRSEAHTLEVGDPTTRQATIAVGMFTETLAVAAAAAGLGPHVECLADRPRDLPIAVVAFDPARDGADLARARRLANAVARRRTYRGSYQGGPLAPAWLTAETLDVPAGVQVAVLPARARRQVAALAGEGMRVALALPDLRRELVGFVHADHDACQDGMLVGDLLPGRRPPRDVRRWLLTDLDPTAQAATVERNFATSPLLVAIASTRDDPAAWFDAGRTGARLLLHAAADGLVHDIAAGPIEIPTLTPLLRDHLPGGQRPQLLVRVGRPPHPLPPRRRPRRRLVLGEQG